MRRKRKKIPNNTKAQLCFLERGRTNLILRVNEIMKIFVRKAYEIAYEPFLKWCPFDIDIDIDTEVKSVFY
jgi:hypothetical protein